MDCRGTVASPWSSPWAAGKCLLQHLLFFLLTDLGVCRTLAVMCTHSTILWLWLLPHRFFTFLKYIIPEALPPSLVGLTLASDGSVLDAGEDSGIFSQNASLLQKVCHKNPIHHVKLFITSLQSAGTLRVRNFLYLMTTYSLFALWAFCSFLSRAHFVNFLIALS